MIQNRKRFKVVALFVVTLIASCTVPCRAESIDQTINTMQNAGMDLIDQKKYKEAEQKFAQLVALCRKNPGPQKMYLQNALRGHASALLSLDRGTDSWKDTEEANRITADESRKAGLAPMGAGLDAMSAAMKMAGGPPSNGAMTRVKHSVLRANARTVQISVESYDCDFNEFPTKLDLNFKSYFPGGIAKIKAGTPPNNPLSDTRSPTWPIVAPINGNLGSTKIAPGSIIYTYSPGGKGYAIYVVDESGKYMMDDNTGKTFVLKNFAGSR